MSSQVTIVRAVQTCASCPSQWDAWDSDGRYWYLRYRHGHGTAECQPGPAIKSWEDKYPEFEFWHGGPLDGSITLGGFCARAGMGVTAAVLGLIEAGGFWFQVREQPDGN